MAELVDLPAYAWAAMAELVDAHDSKSCGAIHESSILSRGIGTGRRARTTQNRVMRVFILSDDGTILSFGTKIFAR